MVLFLYCIWRDILHYRRERDLLARIGVQSVYERVEPDAGIGVEDGEYISDDRRDEVLRRRLGDALYRQVVSDQNYGKVG